jgi:Trypsin-like peptidase domain
MIKVPGRNLPYLNLESAENISVGQHVLAIGSPLGLENSVSDGIVSGFRDGENGKSWIQTTAPASHGNSGGPLIVMNGKVAGVLAWKAGEGENLNFAVPSKLIVPLLTHSAVQPLGAFATATKPTSPTGSPDRIWTSMTSGRDYKVRVEGDYIYTEWVNLPSQLQNSAAFVRSELKKDGDRWRGKVRSNLPYEFKSSYGDFWTTGQRMGTENVKWCQIEVDFEIDRVSESRIEGQAMMPSSFDAKKCKPGKSDMKPFTWILK